MVASDEPIAWFAGEDPAMIEAIRLSQSTFDEFLDAIKSRDDIEKSLVKYMFAATDAAIEFEHMFLSDFRFDGDVLVGVLCSEPQHVTGLQVGDDVVVERNRVSDWLYVVDGVGTGGQSFQVMWQSFSPEERAMYRDQAPFRWLELDK